MTASFFHWLDYSDQERRRALEAIALFRERDIRDELGIGAVRDSFADLFFPGTSTIQTRAKYFLFIPWIYQKLQEQGISPYDISKKVRDQEIKLINALIQSGEEDGVIGFEARAALKRMPSNVYWQGLHSWGIRLVGGGQYDFHRRWGLHTSAIPVREDDQTDSGLCMYRSDWDPCLPDRPKGFPEGASFALTREEAQYLGERIVTKHPNSMLAFLLQEKLEEVEFEFPWQHIQYAKLPPRIQGQLEHARKFSEIMHGAALLYNLMLARALPNDSAMRSERIDFYVQELAGWQGNIERRIAEFQKWDLHELWALVLCQASAPSPRTRRFVEAWIGLVRQSRQVIDNAAAEQLIATRERAIKNKLARLDNPGMLGRWPGYAGTRQLSYRWPVTTRLMRDILAPLSGRE